MHSETREASPPGGSLDRLRAEVREFVKEREWDKYHSPKNLAIALIGEAGELVERFQWLSEEESSALSQRELDRVGEEVGDVLIYLVSLCDRLGIDPIVVAEKKLLVNAKKYPVEKARGNAKKYTDLT